MDPTVYAQAIKDIESSGGDYGAVGPATSSGDKAYGAYQVMGSNIPDWTEKHYGQRLTPQQFLSNKDAQDKVFHGQFGSYVDKYGTPQDAASAWFTGRTVAQNNNDSDGYTTANQYVDRFNSGVAKYSGSPVAAINAAAGIKPRSGPALAFSGEDDATPDDSTPQGMLSAPPGALSGRVMKGNGGLSTKDRIAQGLTGMGAALASISSPAQAGALNAQLAAMKKDQESGYKVMATKDGRIIRYDQDGNVDVVGGTPTDGNGSQAPQMIPTWGDTKLLGDDPTKATPDQHEAYLKSMQGSQGDMVRGLLDTTLPAPTAAALARKDSPYPAAFAAARKIDPTLDPNSYSGRVAGYRDWATKGAESARALNQTIAHQSGVLVDAMNSLHNYQSPLANDVKNIWGEKVMGKDSVPVFRTAAHAVVDELGKVFKQNNLSDTEIRKWEENLPANMSPEQQRGQVGAFRKLMDGAMSALEDKRKQAVGVYAAAKARPLLSDEGRAGLAKLDTFANSKPTDATPAPAAAPAIDHGAIDAELKRRGLM